MKVSADDERSRRGKRRGEPHGVSGGGKMILNVKVQIQEPIAGNMSPEHKASGRRWTRQKWESGEKLGERRNEI